MQQQWEDEIINCLKGKINYCGIDAFPENPANFVKHKVGNVHVRYSGTKWDQSDISQGYQRGKVGIEIVLLFRKLRGKQGLYDTMNDIRAALYNRRPTKSTSGIQFESEDLLDVEQGIWQYGIKIGFNCLWVPVEVAGSITNEINVNIDSTHCNA